MYIDMIAEDILEQIQDDLSVIKIDFKDGNIKEGLGKLKSTISDMMRMYNYVNAQNNADVNRTLKTILE